MMHNLADDSENPTRLNLSIHTLIEVQARQAPDAIAIFAPGRSPLPYHQLLAQIDEFGRTLNQLGIGRQDRVAIVLPNGPEMAIAFLGVASVATCAPLNPAYRSQEFDFYLSDLEARALIVSDGMDSPAIQIAQSKGIPVIRLVSNAEKSMPTCRLVGNPIPRISAQEIAQPSDVALVLHTSGTTSRPKMVPLTHTNLCASAVNIQQSLGLVPRDCCLNIMPLFHIHGLMAAVLASLTAGASVVCTPGFDALALFGWLEKFQPTWYTAVPTMHQAILDRASGNSESLARHPLRFIRSCSSALAPLLLQELEKTFRVPVVEAYGMTEASHQMTTNPLPPHPRKPGSVGRATGIEVAIMNEAGELQPQRQLGEVVIRGESVTQGYVNNPEANAQAFTDGWFRTGDQGYLDQEQYLFLTGRIKELINRAGEKISPRQVDEVLLAHPAIAQAVTFALYDPKMGEDIGAAVVLKENSTTSEKDLREFVAERLARFKVPRRILIVSEIPKGPTGKIQRIGLAKKLRLE